MLWQNILMKKLYFFTILFLFSCSDTKETSREKSELDRCINANVVLIQNSDIEELGMYPEVLRLPVKIDINSFISIFSESELDEEFVNEIVINLSNQDNVFESFRSLQEKGYFGVNLKIYLDDDEVIISPLKNEKIIDMQDLLTEFSNNISETELEIIYSSTIRIAGEDEIAKNICWSQGIY